MRAENGSDHSVYGKNTNNIPPIVIELIKSGLKVREIPGWPRYWVSNDGQIVGRRGRLLKPSFSKRGYAFVSLPRNGAFVNAQAIAVQVHKLVLLAFVGPKPEGMQCRHLDGNKVNNHISNLVWGTASENALDRIRHNQQLNQQLKTIAVLHEAYKLLIASGKPELAVRCEQILEELLTEKELAA